MPINVPKINPRLATIQAPNLPKIDVLGAVNAGFGISDKLKQNRQDEALQTLIQEQGHAALAGNQEALDQIALQGKDGAALAGQLQGIVSSRNADAFTTAQNQLKKNGTFFASIINLEPEAQQRALFDRSNELLSEGDRENGGEMLQISQSRDLLDMQGYIEQNLILSQGGDKYLQGFTNQGKGSGGLASAKTEIFRNGAAIQALPSGEIQVRDPAGRIVTGEERLQVLRDAQQSGILQAGDVARAQQEARQEVALEAPKAKRAEKEAVIKEQAQVSEASDNLALVDELLGSNLDIIYGRLESFVPAQLRSQEGQNLIAKRDRLASQLELAAAGKLKGQGQITENERKVLRESVSALKNTDISPEQALSELERVRPQFEAILQKVSNEPDTGISAEEFSRLSPTEQQAILRNLRGQ